MSDNQPANFDALDGLEKIGETRIAPGHAIGAIALNMAMKYHDMSTVKDGMLYQQYKLEGKNMVPLHLDMVFETAMRIERHLLGSCDRIAAMVVEAVVEPYDDDEPNPPDEASKPTDKAACWRSISSYVGSLALARLSVA